MSNILFYGHEVSLASFELASFVIFDIAFSSFVVSAAVTFCISAILSHLRLALAKQNISKKTLIDKRFLI